MKEVILWMPFLSTFINIFSSLKSKMTLQNLLEIVYVLIKIAFAEKIFPVVKFIKTYLKCGE